MAESPDNLTSPRHDNQSHGDDRLDEVDDSELITLPRWIVYFQGAMLGVVAATFFVFGMMVGNLTSGANSTAEQRFDVQVSGEVVYLEDGKEVSDSNSVVMLLPMDLNPDQRSDAEAVHPDSFQPLDNVGIDRVNALGGAIVRVDERGRFLVDVDGPQEYYVLVVSANRKPDDPPRFSKPQKAAVATFFKPVEDVIGGNAFHWETVYASGDRIEISKIVFE